MIGDFYVVVDLIVSGKMDGMDYRLNYVGNILNVQSVVFGDVDLLVFSVVRDYINSITLIDREIIF